MRRTRVVTTFEGGQADKQFARRSHEEIAARTVKSLRNVRVRTGGSGRRRPGLALISSLAGYTRMIPFLRSDGTRQIMMFSATRLDVFNTAGAVVQTITGCPWQGSDVGTMQFGFDNDRLYVTSRSFPPQRLLFAGTWGRVAFVFDTGGNGSTKQPYYRYAARGVTLQPNGLTGSVNILANNNIFTVGDVGSIFRILGREMLATAYVSATTLTVTCVQNLYPTLRLTVPSTTAFAPGDQCEFSITKYHCEVYQIVSATVLDVVLTDNYVGPTVATDFLIGPNGATTAAISASAAAPANAATTQWDQAMISAKMGYPGGCEIHRGRLFFYDFPNAPSYLAASAIGLFTSFDVGNAEDSDAIVDALGDNPGTRIRHLVSQEQLIALTDGGAYYAGEGRGQPITPTTLAFYRIGPEPAGSTPPVVAAEGVLYADTKADRLVVIAPTGNIARTWEPLELGEMAPDVMNLPVRLAFVDGSAWGPERYVVAVNADGTLGVMFFRRGGDVVAWTPWDTDGLILDVIAFDRVVWAVVQRGVNYTLESFDDTRLLDRSLLMTTTLGVAPTNINLANESVTLVWRKTVSAQARRGYMGVFPADGAGALNTAPTEARDYEAGRDFTVRIEPWEPYDPITLTLLPTRISDIGVDLLESGCVLVAGGGTLSPYRMTDDATEPPPLKTGTRRRKLLGRKRDNTLVISQTEAAPLEVRSIVMKVS